MTVLAHCSNCPSTHPLGTRELSDDSQSKTECPNCGSPTYVSQTTTDGPTDDDVRERLLALDGVGDGTVAALTDDLQSLTAVSYVGRQRLEDVPHVGTRTALQIYGEFD